MDAPNIYKALYYLFNGDDNACEICSLKANKEEEEEESETTDQTSLLKYCFKHCCFHAQHKV